MKSYTIIACLVLLGSLACPKVSATNSNPDTDFYVEDEGSGEGPEISDPAFTHEDDERDEDKTEGSGYGSKGPYDGYYDYDDTDDTGDDGDHEDPFYIGTGFEEENIEGSGRGGTILIDAEDEDPRLGGNDREIFEEIIEEEIVVNEKPTKVESRPATHPPPTLTDTNDNMDNSVQILSTDPNDRQVSVFAQPGILAAFIGGAVVGLLCAILLVMFIVYRMRKKDEGSYPLDEPKRMPLTSSYSPNDKEIYA